MASVTFTCECRETKLGEGVFLTGAPDVLGSWSTQKAVPMVTTQDTFPTWSSAPLPLPVGQAVEYKFLLRREDAATGAVTWESFPGNHAVTAPPCCCVAASAWGQEKVAVTQVPGVQPKGPSPEEELARKVHEDAMLKKAELDKTEAAAEVRESCPLANTIADREPMRRNFSQSLMCLDVDDEGQIGGSRAGSKAASRAVSRAASKERQAAGGTAVYQQPEDAEAEVSEEETERRGVPLQHIMSFSALTEMLDAEEKTEGRKKKKAQSHYEAYNIGVPVVIVTSEIAPWSKTGGLGLVASSYSYEFARNGHRTMAVSPKYRHYENINYVGETRVMVDGREELVKYFHRYMDYGDGKGCDYVFVDHPSIEREGGLYNGDDGREYHDNLLRFTLLSLAAMEAPLILNIRGSRYGDKVLFLANDWQSGLVPLYLCYKYRKHNCYTQARAIYVVHNLGYQGQYHGVNACRFFGIDQQAASDIGYGNCINLTKGALICADRVLTVSPNYAQEIQTPQGGFNLQDFVRAKAHAMRLGGILNGIDDCWNPESDTNIVRNYSVDDFEPGKRANKIALQRMVGLQEDPDVVVIGFIGRLTWQKGVDVLGGIINWLMQDLGNGVNGRAHLIMMGNGERQHSDTLRWAEGAYKGRVCGYVGFDPKVEHQMMAGCDLFLMPSRYEPCGLPQMYSQQYGTLPIVTATGGLVDSVIDIAQGIDKATGFHISPLSVDKMKESVYRAMELYWKRPQDFRCMQRTAMQTDFYWPRAMDEYEKHIDYTLYDPPSVR